MTRLTAAMALLLVGGPFSAVPAAETGSRELSIELAFRHKALAPLPRMQVSGDGRFVAYEVYEPDELSSTAIPPRSPYDEILDQLPRDTPRGWRVSQLMLTETATKRSRAVAPPEKRCWWPVFSPDNKRLAFYCQSGVLPRRSPQLWIHDIAAQSTQKVSSAEIYERSLARQSVNPFTEAPALWSADGKELFVVVTKAGAAVFDPPKAPAKDAGIVSVYRSGEERAAEAEEDEDWVKPWNLADFGWTAHVSDGIEVLPLAWKQKGDQAEDIALVAIDATSGAERVVLPTTVKRGPCLPHITPSQLSPSGKWISFGWDGCSASMELSVTSASDSKTIPLADAISTAPFEATGRWRAPRLAPHVWHPKRDQIFWIKEGHLWTADLSVQSSPVQLAATLGNLSECLGVTPDGGTLLVGRKETPSLVAIPLAGGEPRILPLPSDIELLQVIRQSEGVLWQPGGPSVAVLARRNDRQRVVIEYDLKSGKSRTLWQGRGDIAFAGTSADGSALFGAYEDMDTPANLYRFPRGISARTQITKIDARFDGLRFTRSETFPVSVPQHDGTRITVNPEVFLPLNARRGEKLPTLVIQYPRRTDASFDRFEFGGGTLEGMPVSMFTSRGYAVLRVSGPVFPFSTRGNMSKDLVDVMLPQIQEAAARGYIDIDRVAVEGASFGGYAVAMLLSATNVFRAGIAFSGVYDLTYYPTASPTGRAGGMPGPERASFLSGLWGVPDLPWADLDTLMDNSPFFRADRIRTPLLIVHATQDRVPVEDARKMFNALRLLGRTAQFAEYAGVGHHANLLQASAEIDVGQRILAFLEKYVKPRTPEP